MSCSLDLFQKQQMAKAWTSYGSRKIHNRFQYKRVVQGKNIERMFYILNEYDSCSI